MKYAIAYGRILNLKNGGKRTTICGAFFILMTFVVGWCDDLGFADKGEYKEQ